jgi:hypothetical protein
MMKFQPNALRLEKRTLSRLMCTMEWEEVQLFLFLLHAQSLTQRKYTCKEIQSLLGFRKIYKALHRLERAGFISVKTDKSNNTKAIRAAQTFDTESPRAHARSSLILLPPLKGGRVVLLDREKGGSSKKRSSNILSLGTSPSTNRTTPQYQLAIKLYNAIPRRIKKRANRLPKVVNGHRDFTAWSKEFARVINRGDYTASEITRAINWYKLNVNDPFTPKLYSARRFCDELWRVFEAIKRSKLNTTQHNQQNRPAAQSKISKIRRRGHRETVELTYTEPEITNSPYHQRCANKGPLGSLDTH